MLIQTFISPARYRVFCLPGLKMMQPEGNSLIAAAGLKVKLDI